MRFGLAEADLTYIISVIEGFTEIEQALVFGSRAKGTYKRGSDVDIAVMGENVSFSTIAQLQYRLQEESCLPYFFDIIDYTHSTHQELKEHVMRVGETIFLRRIESLTSG